MQRQGGGRRCWCCLQGCCRHVFQEDNVRFVLHAVVMAVFCLLGALIFMHLEADTEQQKRALYSGQLDTFLADNPSVNISQLNALLCAHEQASVGGFLNTSRPRWDFTGSLYYVGTLVSTVGFGMSTPRTVAGRVVSIMYGLVGCSGFILFFNLFLERVITLTTCVMRGANACWQRRRRRGSLSVGWAPQQNDVASVESAAAVPDSDSRSSHSQSDGRGGSGGCDDTWKPSVYLVMLVLFLAVLVIGCLSSLLYSWAEQWTFGEAIYFSFCLFATIGFGDFVPLQRSTYAYINTYRVCNALIFVVGCSCMYSLFNVVSIVIKQILNACIYWMEAGCKRMMLSIARLSSGRHRSKIRALQRLGRRNVIGPLTNTSGQGHRHSDSSAYANRPNRVNRSIRHKSADGIVSATSNNNTQRGQERGSDIKVDEGLEVVQQQQQQQQRTPQRSRDQTISVSDSSEEWELNVQQLIKHNQVNLAILQKQLHDTTNAHRRRAHHVIDSHATTNHAHAISISDNSGLKEGVGPLAMLNTKFNGKDSGV